MAITRRQMTIRLTPEAHEQLLAAADEREIPAAWLAGRLVTAGLATLPPPAEWTEHPDPADL